MGLLDSLRKKKAKNREERLERREKRKAKKDRSSKDGMSAMDRARKKLADMDKKGGGGADFLKPQIGKNIIRIAGPWSGNDDDDWSLERGEHWTLDRKSNLTCPKKHGGGDCAFHEAAEPQYAKLKKLKSDRSDAGKAKAERFYQNKVRPLAMQVNNYVNAVFLKDGKPVDNDGNPTNKWLKWSPSPKVFREILAMFIEDEADVCGQFWGPEGYDFILPRTGKGLQTRYGAVRGTRKYMDIDTSDLEINDLSEMLEDVPSYKETKALLAGKSAEDSDEEEPEESDDEFDEDSDDDVE